MIKLKDVLKENSKDGWGSDPNKPKAIAKIEDKVYDLLDSWKEGNRSVRNIESSPRLNRLRNAWDDAVETSGWKAKYNFGDLLA
jgi:hypothetical protein